MFRSVLPVLRVADLQNAIDWYTSRLGFEIIWRSPNDGEGENCMLRAGNVSLLLSTGSHLGDHPKFTGTLYFDTSGVREFYEQVKDKVEVVWPLERMEYGNLEFGIHDCDGYTLAFAESAEHVPEMVGT